MDYVVRKYVADDLDAVLFAWEDASKIAHPFLTEAFLDTERYNIPNLYLPNAETWVIEQNGQVTGFIALLGNEIGAIFVRADCHGTGAGRALMEKAKQLHGDLEVEVFEANSIGRKFYTACGFTFLSNSIHEPTGQPVLRLEFHGDIQN
ncbi:MAG: GNAT family N-acetyltransferase [Rhodospirillaceae bacterium]|jgi:putative acetyltransferase|nr:GNAT family N-acetyltransferase [Rhodospirillaceae bacterium]MBT5455951.1 GNAT family N-acetyltransferase [Rhodospirillaceae bacterium]